MKQAVIGLAGHIDHGKTTLVKALTGINTDSLSEEKKRGMTIDIGFAFLTENVTLIDVPGHEKFVKNMMAGVSGIDVALLVVAADDGIMPQTREHFEILNLLGISTAVIALNKTDLVDEEWLELIELEVNELTYGTFMENVPIIRVSAETGNGIKELKSTLLNACENVKKKYDRGIFRLHADRVFSMKGYGTVVTGTVISGTLTVGDNIEILPSQTICKVRGLQSHELAVNIVCLGDRAAINLQGIDKTEIQRGNQLTTPGYFQSVKQMGIKLRLLSSVTKPIIQNQRIRIHLGTQEVIARIALTENKALYPGDDGSALLRLESHIVAARGDKFIIRSYSPIFTIGGGEVLEIAIKDRWSIIKGKLRALYENSESQQLLRLVQYEGSKPLTLKQLQIRLSISSNEILKWVENDDALFWLSHNKRRWLLTYTQWSILKKRVINFLKHFHEKYPLKAGVEKELIRQHLQCEDPFLDALLQSMLKDKLVEQKGKTWLDASFSITLSDKDQTIQNNILEILDKEGFNSSNLNQLVNTTGYQKDQIMRILQVAELEGKLLRIDENLMFTHTNFINLKNKVRKYFQSSELLSVPEFKELAQTSRKYAVPLLEYFDKKKITYRDGNGRKLVK